MSRRAFHPTRFGPMAAALLISLAACQEPPTAGPDPTPIATERNHIPATDFDLVLDGVEFRPGASADIHVRVFVNESMPCRDRRRTAFFIHGINATAASWERFVKAFFAGDRRRQLCVAAAMDQPGHGGSGLPSGVSFGELMVEDYARAAIETLSRLRAEGIRPTILVGHSQGTSTIQTMQQMLTQEGTDLRGRFGVRDVVFLGTQGPMELRAAFLLPDQSIADLIASLVTTTPEKGTFVQGPPSIFQQLWFINLNLQPSSKTPSLETIAGNGWNADVPLFAVLQAAGQAGFNTPSVAAGVFGPESGSALHLIDFADDPWSLTPRAQEIYEYLTGDASLSGFVTVTDPQNEAVHDYMITHPDLVRGFIDLPRCSGRRKCGRPHRRGRDRGRR